MTLSDSPAARARAGARWTTLGNRLRTVSPEALTKGVIAAGIVGTATVLSVATWPSLLPFVVGAIIAYAVLPIANRLDRFMPRVVAALLAELVAVAILVGVLLIVVPPILQGLVEVALRLPTGEQLRAQLAGLQAQLGAAAGADAVGRRRRGHRVGDEPPGRHQRVRRIRRPRSCPARSSACSTP